MHADGSPSFQDDGPVDHRVATALSDADKQSLLHLARETLTTYLAEGAVPTYAATSSALEQLRATFVTLRRRDTGDLRGCRGEVVARQPLIDSVVHTSISSATEDPRFAPVTAAEVPHLHIEISALTPMEPIRPEEIVIGRHGLMITRGPYAGLLLPQVPTAYGWGVPEYLEALCQKAGLPSDCWRDPSAQLMAFEAEVWQEDPEPPTHH